MLESARLMLRPWVASPSPGAAPVIETWTCSILDVAAQAPLGFARLQTGAGLPWLGWFSRSIMELRETEDESLLAMLHQSWFTATTWQVSEADGHNVGWIRRMSLQDLYGRRFATLLPAQPAQPQQFVAPNGDELGTLQGVAEGTLLTFDLSLENNPFGKMMLLAAALCGQLPIRKGEG